MYLGLRQDKATGSACVARGFHCPCIVKGVSVCSSVSVCGFWPGTQSSPVTVCFGSHHGASSLGLNLIPFGTENGKTRCASRGH